MSTTRFIRAELHYNDQVRCRVCTATSTVVERLRSFAVGIGYPSIFRQSL